MAPVQLVDGTDATNGENLLRQLRKERRMSQAAVARCVGLSRQSLNAIENGKCRPRLVVAYRLARLFERPIENVFLLDGYDELGCT
jgi:putative transcriptional regulator